MVEVGRSAGHQNCPAGCKGAQVGADGIHDGLPLRGVVLGDPFQCVEAAMAHHSFVGAELVDRCDAAQ